MRDDTARRTCRQLGRCGSSREHSHKGGADAGEEVAWVPWRQNPAPSAVKRNEQQLAGFLISDVVNQDDALDGQADRQQGGGCPTLNSACQKASSSFGNAEMVGEIGMRLGGSFRESNEISKGRDRGEKGDCSLTSSFRYVTNSLCWKRADMPLAKDLLHPSPEEEKRRHKKKRLVQSPNSYFMDVKCPGCYKITTVFSHAQTVVLCVGCSTVLCQPTGGKARLTEGCAVVNFSAFAFVLPCHDVLREQGVYRGKQMLFQEKTALAVCTGEKENLMDVRRRCQRCNVGKRKGDNGNKSWMLRRPDLVLTDTRRPAGMAGSPGHQRAAVKGEEADPRQESQMESAAEAAGSTFPENRLNICTHLPAVLVREERLDLDYRSNQTFTEQLDLRREQSGIQQLELQVLGLGLASRLPSGLTGGGDSGVSKDKLEICAKGDHSTATSCSSHSAVPCVPLSEQVNQGGVLGAEGCREVCRQGVEARCELLHPLLQGEHLSLQVLAALPGYHSNHQSCASSTLRETEGEREERRRKQTLSQGSSEGGTHTERKEREKGRRNTVKQEIMEGGMNEETRGIGGQRWRIKEMQKKTNTSLESELREGAAFLKHTDSFATVGVRNHVSIADGEESDRDKPHRSQEVTGHILSVMYMKDSPQLTSKSLSTATNKKRKGSQQADEKKI
ncbi:hypothetical protein CCH79_00010971 [Gambusia affinis]|uniref:40S ribosomal protein S27 n=4 Tax=Euteleostomi TaxID=117571 RepID=A0A315VKY8_GAMAF|nr:hypothetical protein CCH79_00010971 [Gambusia affinis]